MRLDGGTCLEGDDELSPTNFPSVSPVSVGGLAPTVGRGLRALGCSFCRVKTLSPFGIWRQFFAYTCTASSARRRGFPIKTVQSPPLGNTSKRTSRVWPPSITRPSHEPWAGWAEPLPIRKLRFDGWRGPSASRFACQKFRSMIDAHAPSSMVQRVANGEVDGGIRRMGAWNDSQVWGS